MNVQHLQTHWSELSLLIASAAPRSCASSSVSGSGVTTGLDRLPLPAVVVLLALAPLLKKSKHRSAGKTTQAPVCEAGPTTDCASQINAAMRHAAPCTHENHRDTHAHDTHARPHQRPLQRTAQASDHLSALHDFTAHIRTSPAHTLDKSSTRRTE
jgi:hypothetical protein